MDSYKVRRDKWRVALAHDQKANRSAAALAVALHLSDYMRFDRPEVVFTYGQIAKALGYSPEGVKKGLKLLVDLGYLHKVTADFHPSRWGRQTPNTYSMNFSMIGPDENSTKNANFENIAEFSKTENHYGPSSTHRAENYYGPSSTPLIPEGGGGRLTAPAPNVAPAAAPPWENDAEFSMMFEIAGKRKRGNATMATLWGKWERATHQMNPADIVQGYRKHLAACGRKGSRYSGDLLGKFLDKVSSSSAPSTGPKQAKPAAPSTGNGSAPAKISERARGSNGEATATAVLAALGWDKRELERDLIESGFSEAPDALDEMLRVAAGFAIVWDYPEHDFDRARSRSRKEGNRDLWDFYRLTTWPEIARMIQEVEAKRAAG